MDKLFKCKHVDCEGGCDCFITVKDWKSNKYSPKDGVEDCHMGLDASWECIDWVPVESTFKYMVKSNEKAEGKK